jgi:integrase
MAKKMPEEPLYAQDLRALMRNLEKHKGLLAMLGLVVGAGLTMEECLQIRLSDIDYSTSRVRIYDKWYNHWRHVQLSPRIIAMVSEYHNGRKEEDKRLFMLSATSAARYLDELGKARLGRRVSWPELRHLWVVMIESQEPDDLLSIVDSKSTTVRRKPV